MPDSNPATPQVSLNPLDKIITELDAIADWSLKNKNRNGYFAALYKNITARVKYAIQKREFEDPERMEDFVVIFAGFYINAHKKYQAGTLEKTQPWFYVFEKGEKRLSIIQHMLMGVNVHINYDLANTCYKILPGPEMIYLSKDYFRINLILSSAVTQVEKEIFSLSPLVSLLAMFIPKLERKILNFSLSNARSRSWECACQQAVSDDFEREEIKKRSEEMAEELCWKIVSPGILGSVLMFFVSLFELRGIRKNIEVLRQKPVV